MGSLGKEKRASQSLFYFIKTTVSWAMTEKREEIKIGIRDADVHETQI